MKTTDGRRGHADAGDGERCGAALCTLPEFLAPGGEADAVVFGDACRVRDHGELLAHADGSEPERAKCLHLSVARSIGMEPAALLAALKKRAQQFLDEVPAPRAGEDVPEAVLCAFELAHDLVERDHPQMRSSLLWFGDEVLADVQVNFVCVMPDGDVRVELFKGREFSASGNDARLGWVVCASSHARELVSPVGADRLAQWELTVMEQSGTAPGLFYMSGYPHLLRALRSFRGDVRMRDPATLFKCEICPSLHARPLRVRQRRFIGAGEAGGDPLLVMATEAGVAALVSQSRVVLSGMSADRESAAEAAAAMVLAGGAIEPPPRFFSGVLRERV